VLLGPSGSGKSTVLRMIAGLAEVDQGRISLGGRDVTHLPPQQRGIGMVFQHYALFRHMSAAENIEFPLRIRRSPAGERRRRREELLELVGLAGLGARMPAQLSGGQQQRVALARALAHKPEVLLLDEPFGALDARIRAELRRTIRDIQNELGVTTIFVTHDQDEAFELADRMGIMNFGRLLEVGPPHELYLRPKTEFAATFLGAANLMVGECTPGGVRLGPLDFPLGTELMAEVGGARRVQVLFRPEDVAVKDSAGALSSPALGRAVVEESSFSGSFEKLRLRLPPLAGVRPIAPPAPFGAEYLLIDAIRSQHLARQHPLHVGDEAWVGVRRLHALSHPGLSILLAAEPTAVSTAAVAMGAAIARMAHARVTLVACAPDGPAAEELLQTARADIGAGLTALESRHSSGSAADAVAAETRAQHCDLVVAGLEGPQAADTVSRMLRGGEHNLLLVPAELPVPSRALICVAVGEPSKENVLFAGRLIRHLRTEATLMTVLAADRGAAALEHAERFLAAGRRTLALMGVPSRSVVRRGDLVDQILTELADGGHDLLVMGAHAGGAGSRSAVDAMVGALLERGIRKPLLVARSHQAAPKG
jgi:sulfate transport system ATP-binding protein